MFYQVTKVTPRLDLNQDPPTRLALTLSYRALSYLLIGDSRPFPNYSGTLHRFQDLYTARLPVRLAEAGQIPHLAPTTGPYIQAGHRHCSCLVGSSTQVGYPPRRDPGAATLPLPPLPALSS